MYPVNEIFYSLQGEGRWTGRPAVFVRFSGCNLRCPFCDTDHGHFQEMDVQSIIAEVENYAADYVVLTGGEPSLYTDIQLVEMLHSCGKVVGIETNGTRELPEDIDWITLSPKDCYVDNSKVVLKCADEIKIVFDAEKTDAIERYAGFDAKYYYIQPCDMGNKERNKAITAAAVAYCLDHPQWSLSLQQHKILKIK
ncbi:MAG: radical SAM protein [Bacteroidaceae bacterium]|nr:radical SAM protein [Bacteroidaceae bacterium]